MTVFCRHGAGLSSLLHPSPSWSALTASKRRGARFVWPYEVDQSQKGPGSRNTQPAEQRRRTSESNLDENGECSSQATAPWEPSPLTCSLLWSAILAIVFMPSTSRVRVLTFFRDSSDSLSQPLALAEIGDFMPRKVLTD